MAATLLQIMAGPGIDQSKVIWSFLLAGLGATSIPQTGLWQFVDGSMLYVAGNEATEYVGGIPSAEDEV